MTTREDVSNFKFFDAFLFDEQGGTHDTDVAAVTTATIDTQGYETCMFGWKHGSMMSVGSIADQIHVRMQHASNSTTGVNTLGSWSDCTAGDVYGFDMYRCMSDLTIDSWLLLDARTRTKYLFSIPVPGFATRAVSGCFCLIGISVTSQASCTTESFMPTVAYMGKQRWVRLVFSQSTAVTAGVGSTHILPFAVLGRAGQWPVTFAEVV